MKPCLKYPLQPLQVLNELHRLIVGEVVHQATFITHIKSHITQVLHPTLHQVTSPVLLGRLLHITTLTPHPLLEVLAKSQRQDVGYLTCHPHHPQDRTCININILIHEVRSMHPCHPKDVCPV